MSNSITSIEAGSISFSNQSSVTTPFSLLYDYVPYVTVTSTKNVNIFIESVTTTQLTVGTSEKITGTVYFQAIERTP